MKFCSWLHANQNLICCRLVQTCSKKLYYSLDGSIEININADHNNHEFDCSFSIHLPIGKRIHIGITVFDNQDHTTIKV